MKNKIIVVYGDAKCHYLVKEIRNYLVKQGFIVFYYDFYDFNYEERLTEYEVQSVKDVFETEISLCDYFIFVNTNKHVRSKRSNDMINKAWGYKKPIIYFHENCNDDITQILPYIDSKYNLEKEVEESQSSDSKSKEDEIYCKIMKEIDEIKNIVYDIKKYIEERIDK